MESKILFATGEFSDEKFICTFSDLIIAGVCIFTN